MSRGLLAELCALIDRVRPARAEQPPVNMPDRDPRTLDHWRHQFTGTSRTIECRDMRLLGRDEEGDIFTGPGRIVIDERGIRFFLYGKAADGPSAFRKYLAAGANPYDELEQFRLFATDYRGTAWTGGYTTVDFFADHNRDWPLTGELQGLSTHVSDFWVAKTAGVEMLLTPPVDLPLEEAMVTNTRIGDDHVFWSRGSGRQRLDALGSTITFELDPSEKALWITATASHKLPPTQAELWLAEPLRIMLGALIYPRLIARNFGNGTSSVTFLPAPTKRRPSPFGLMQPFVADSYPGRAADFWRLYIDILSMIARTDNQNLQYHQVTRLYEELIQTQKSSRWVMSMTLASTIEALAKSVMTETDRRSEYSDKDIAAMEKYFREWKGSKALLGHMLNNLGRAGERSILGFMKRLAREGVLDKDDVSIWRELRNAVMHGELTVPWSTEEGDRHMRQLIALTHALTRLRVGNG
jgi:hypothetical protein